jgi:hypothetical protein
VTILAPGAALAADGIDWTTTTPASGEVEGSEVRVDGAGTHRLVTIIAPDISGDSYAVTGSVRFEGVTGAGYLEMWSHFADGGAYFSRTLGSEGPTASLTGDSAGRPFELPFFLDGADGPDRIEINVILPQTGTVWVGPLDLVGFGATNEWWTPDQARLIGVVGGILAGLLGAVLGILGGRRRYRRFVEATLIGGAAVGAVLIVFGVVAAMGGQPHHVWFPVLLIGEILAVVNGLLVPVVRGRYETAELHRIRALDA